MTDSHDHEDLQRKLEQFAKQPRDVVPRGEGETVTFTPGDHVTVRWPGDVITGADGNIVGVDAPKVYETVVVTDSGVLVGWVTDDDEGDEQS